LEKVSIKEVNILAILTKNALLQKQKKTYHTFRSMNTFYIRNTFYLRCMNTFYIWNTI
jgi:hypothetical protein